MSQSHYSDAEDSLSDTDTSVLRKRKIWDPDSASIASEIKDLLEDDVNSLVKCFKVIFMLKQICTKQSNKVGC